MSGRTKTGHWNELSSGKQATYQYKLITPKMIKRVEGSVKALLHASRDSLRNGGVDTSKVRFDCRDGYMGEAFGIMRSLEMMGYGRLGSVNMNGLEDISTRYKAKQPEHNLRWWFSNLEYEVLEEENYKGDGYCEYCRSRHYSDTKSALEDGRLNKEQKKLDHAEYMRQLREFAAKEGLDLEVAAKLSGLLDNLEDCRIR